MRRISSYLALIGMFFLWSCEEETLEPRTNPRFSVTIVQEISADGVQFGANIYDYGNEEILEYGFVYTQNAGVPNLSQDDYVTGQGRPGERFELVANHSMTIGKKYYVSAFLKTSTSLVFSKSIEFISQGSEGFIVESVEWPELIYKAQNLVVKGRRFSKQRANYKVKIGQFDIYPNLVDSTTLLLPLPEGILTQTTGQDIEMEFRLEISEKVYTERKVLKFQEPVFEILPLQQINLDGEVLIKGDFLDVGAVGLRFNGQLLPIANPSKNEIKFKPYPSLFFPSNGVSNPELILEARGIQYSLGVVFELNPSRLVTSPIVFDQEKNFIVGENFNTKELSANRFVDQFGVELSWPYEIISSELLAVYPRNSLFSSREFSVRVKNFGKYSNPVNLRLDFAEVRLFSSGRVEGAIEIGPSTTLNGKGYSLTSAGIIEESLDIGFSNKILAPLPDKWFNFSYQVKLFKSGLFIFGGGVDEQQKPKQKLYSYSIQFGKWEELTDLPNGNFSFTRIHEVSDGIIFEQGYKPGTNFFIEANQERWHFSVQNRTWKRLPDTEIEEGQTVLTFNYKGASYAFGMNSTNISRELQRYDEASAKWSRVAIAPSIWRSAYANPLILDGKIFVFQPFSESVEFDLENFSFRTIGSSGDTGGDAAFVKGKSIYKVPVEGIVYDFRPDLLK